jgi:hypothetical protein
MSHINICKLPNQGWINLALIRQVEYDNFNYDTMIVIVTWSNGEKQVFHSADAKALIDSWNEQINSSLQRCNHRQLNRRCQ